MTFVIPEWQTGTANGNPYYSPSGQLAQSEGANTPLVASLNPYKISVATVNNTAGPAPGNSVTLFSSPANTYGIVSKIKLIGTGNDVLGRLRISYDQGATFAVDAEVGTLWGGYFANQSLAGAPATTASDAHVAATWDEGGQFVGIMNYDIPYSNGILIQIYAPPAYDLSGAVVFSEITYTTLTSPNLVPPYQFRITAASFGTNTATNAVYNGSTGITLTSPNIANNGGAFSGLPTTGIAQMANITGKGWVVGMSYLGNTYGTNNQSWMSRGIGWYIDGATPPLPSGSTTTPSRGAPNGTQVGSPTIQMTGTEDAFDSAWYAFNGSIGGFPAIGNLSGSTGHPNTPAVPLTTVAQQNNWAVPMDVYISTGGATITAITIGSTLTGGAVATGLTTAGLYRVGPGESITLTYTGGPPTWKWYAETKEPNPTFSSPNACMWSNGVSQQFTFSAHLDLLQACGGYRYLTSLQTWLLTSSSVTNTHGMSWAIQYYADLTTGTTS
jgi:hypothetical protein